MQNGRERSLKKRPSRPQRHTAWPYRRRKVCSNAGFYTTKPTTPPGPMPEQLTPKRGPKPDTQPRPTPAKKKKKGKAIIYHVFQLTKSTTCGQPPSANARPSQKITHNISVHTHQLLENDNNPLTEPEDS